MASIHRFLNPSKNQRVLAKIPQKGAGLGNLLRTFVRYLIPIGRSALKESLDTGRKIARSKLVQNAAKTLKRDAVNAGIALTQSALQGGAINRDRVSTEAKKITDNLAHSVTKSLEDYKPKKKKKKQKKYYRDNLG